jgi:hypothetical protein
MGLFDNFGIGNVFGNGIFGNNLPVVMDESVYPKDPLVEIIGEILHTFRGVESDRLTQERELAEIDAKVNMYTEYVSYHKETLNKGYDLEKREIELIQMITNKIMGLIEKLEEVEENSAKFKIYIEQINRCQKILEKIVDNSGKYFNQKILEVNRIK